MEKWIVWAASCVRVFFFSGSMKSNGVVLEELVVKLDTSYAVVGWAFGLQHGMAYLFAPCTRFLLKVLSHRQVATIGGFLTGAGYIFFGLQGSSVYQLLIGFSVSGIGFGLATLPSYLNLEQHFPDNFSLMISLVSPFNFVGVTLLPPVLQFLQSVYGLNHGLVLFGAILMNLIPCGVALRKPSSPKVKTKSGRSDQTMEVSPFHDQTDAKKEASKEDKLELEIQEEITDLNQQEHGNCGVALRRPLSPKVKTKSGRSDQTDAKNSEGSKENSKLELESQEEITDLNQQEHGTCCTNFGDKYFFFVSSLFHHPNFAIVAVLEFAGIYLYTSWALFLVSLGVTAGLSQNEAVYLSSAGGIGGLAGTILAALVFRINKMNAYTCCFFPFLLLILSFLLYSFATNFYVPLMTSGGCGCLLGYTTTAVFGIAPTLICRRHFQQAIVFSFVLDGIATQFGGLFSGLLQDIFKSTRFVYLANAILSAGMLPLILIWACNNQTVKQCSNDVVEKNEAIIL